MIRKSLEVRKQKYNPRSPVGWFVCGMEPKPKKYNRRKVSNQARNRLSTRRLNPPGTYKRSYDKPRMAHMYVHHIGSLGSCTCYKIYGSIGKVRKIG